MARAHVALKGNTPISGAIGERAAALKSALTTPLGGPIGATATLQAPSLESREDLARYCKTAECAQQMPAKSTMGRLKQPVEYGGDTCPTVTAIICHINYLYESIKIC